VVLGVCSDKRGLFPKPLPPVDRSSANHRLDELVPLMEVLQLIEVVQVPPYLRPECLSDKHRG
jgi:hypothetical protein